ncbi:YciI family protein [Pseudonocardia acaciae]|uniref:YciI family protein n=1 Tax=Pseudonocardia acaciae TaxID=551276 RepID=UPI000688D65C|nr:YciI family protein [Pseudonocardia acaciae]
MKYLLLVYGGAHEGVEPTEEIIDSGELIDHAPVADPINATTVRVRDRAVTTAAGPYLESGERLAGYLVVDCDGAEQAIAIAARLPAAGTGAVEVRPLMGSNGMEM